MDNVIYTIIAVSVAVFVLVKLRRRWLNRKADRTRPFDTAIFSELVKAIKSELTIMEEKGDTLDVSELLCKLDSLIDGYIALIITDRWLDDGYLPKRKKGHCWFNMPKGKLVLTLKAVIGYNEFLTTIDIPDIVELKQSYTLLELEQQSHG